jgi:hypothetical protein
MLDANVFISAHQGWYPFDVCPGFWLALVRQHEAKRIVSIDRVKAELIGMDDDLKEGVQQTAPKTFFKGTADPNVVDAFTEMVQLGSRSAAIHSGSQG